eukprot:7255075-Prymnesium_polylepis.1
MHSAAPRDNVALFLEDKEVRQLLEQDKAFERILIRLQAAKQASSSHPPWVRAYTQASHTHLSAGRFCDSSGT